VGPQIRQDGRAVDARDIDGGGWGVLAHALVQRAPTLAAVLLAMACGAAPPSKNVHFPSGKAEPRAPSEYLTIGRTTEALHRDQKLRLLLVGHTDSVGSDETNRDLAFRRAERVREVITEDDPSLAGRIRIAYHGEAEPIASNDDEEGRALNRRVELFFYRPKLGANETTYLQSQFGGKLEFSASASASIE
jgi:hypothetical protein